DLQFSINTKMRMVMRLSSESRVDSAQKMPDRLKTAGGVTGWAAPACQWALDDGSAAADTSSGSGAARTSATGRMPSSATSGDAGSASSPIV
ncbi:hypothetical protein KPA97_14945, partial [Burkholderia cenocepacia]|nr:hypothetical protein [Burkholderia cenocepacia]